MSKESEFRIRPPRDELSQSQKPIELGALDDYPYKSVALGSTRANLTGLWRYWRPYYQTKRAPCDASCPVGNFVVDYIQLLHEGNYREAANTLRAENPLPAITGRICHRPCEVNCNRRQYDQRIAIHDIEAALAEVSYEPLEFPAGESSRTIAVVGSGPAELSFAHFMALLGHQVTLFESQDTLGGVLRTGRQARLLPEGLLDAEIERVIGDRITVRHRPGAVEEIEKDFEVVFGALKGPDQIVLHLAGGRPIADSLRGTSGAVGEDIVSELPLKVSEAIGYGKWVALLLDADWRGLDAADTLLNIQVGGSNRIVSAMKYLALLTGHEVTRSEQVVTYDMLHLEVLDEQPFVLDSAHATDFRAQVGSSFVSQEHLERVLEEVSRCLSCGRCNNCDNCWVYCPDASISRNGASYEIDYDYCKGCTLCAAVCPRGVISITEESKANKERS